MERVVSDFCLGAIIVSKISGGWVSVRECVREECLIWFLVWFFDETC